MGVDDRNSEALMITSYCPCIVPTVFYFVSCMFVSKRACCHAVMLYSVDKYRFSVTSELVFPEGKRIACAGATTSVQHILEIRPIDHAFMRKEGYD